MYASVMDDDDGGDDGDCGTDAGGGDGDDNSCAGLHAKGIVATSFVERKSSRNAGPGLSCCCFPVQSCEPRFGVVYGLCFEEQAII